jgi:hypothetical protein
VPPIRLTDAELDQVFRAAAPLAPADRDAFLQDVARRLSAITDVGPGAVYKACVAAQREFFEPPDLDFGSGRWSKYRG